MRRLDMRHSLSFRGQGQLGIKAALLFLVLALADGVGVWAQDEKLFAPGVRVLATLESNTCAWSPDGRRLAYMTNDGVWIVEAPKFNQARRLIRKGHCAAGSCPGLQLSWSPDGQKLSFVDSRPGDGGSTIWIADADGSHVRDLLPPGAPFSVVGSRAVGISDWLSNREIAFYLHCGAGCVSLNEIDVESGAYKHFCTGSVDGAYYWAPTRKLAIGEMHLGGLSLIKRENGKSISDISSSPEECQTVLLGCVYKEDKIQGEERRFDAWSPDGKQVLYTSWACQQQPIVESEVSLSFWEVGNSRQLLLIPNAGWGAWSPDGSKIAFLLFGEPSYDSDKRILSTDFAPGKPLRIYLGILEAATKAVSTLVPLASELLNPGNGNDWDMFRPVWAPDGKRLVIRNPQKDLILVWADGSRHQPLTQGVRLEAYCDATCTQWSPNGKWLAVLPAGKFPNLGEGKGLEHFLPPVGKDDAALSDAEVIQRYFQHILAQGPHTYAPFLWEYIRALEEMGKVETAEEQYRRAIETVQHSERWRGTSVETDLKQSYAEFLCQHGREKDAAEWGACTPPSGWPHQQDLLRDRP